MALTVMRRPDPLAGLINNYLAGISQQAQQQQQQQKINQDMQNLQQHQANLQGYNTAQNANMLDPSFQAQLGQQIQGAGGQLTPTLRPQAPQFQSQLFQEAQARNAANMLDPAYVAQLDLTRAQAEKARVPTALPVSTQLHTEAIRQGFAPGTPEYDRVTKGATATRPERTSGPLITAKQGDPSGFEPGTVYQLDKDGTAIVKQTPKSTTATDFQIVQDDSGQFVRVNKLTGKSSPITGPQGALKGKVDPEQKIKGSFIKKHGDPVTWNDDTWAKYNETASKVKVTNQRPLPAGSIEGLNAKAQMVGVLKEMRNVASANSDLLGPIAGRYTTIKDALGAATGREAAFVQLIAQRGTYIRELAGAAFTQTEKGLYFPMFPGQEDNVQAFVAKTNQLEKLLSDRLNGEVSVYNKTGYKNLNANDLIGIYTPGNTANPVASPTTPQATAPQPATDQERANFGSLSKQRQREILKGMGYSDEEIRKAEGN